MKIHPTAIVDPGARLGEEVEIGPYALIGAEVEIGPHTIVQSHVVIEGAVRLGAANKIGHGAIIGSTPQDLGFKEGTKSSVEIGDRNVIREHVTIHRGTAADSATRLGHDNFLMAGAHLGHNCAIGNNVIIANNCLLGGYVAVDDGAFLGGNCVFHQFMRVGRLRDHAGRFRLWQRYPAICRRGRREQSGWLECRRLAARRFQRRRAGRDQGCVSPAL